MTLCSMRAIRAVVFAVCATTLFAQSTTQSIPGLVTDCYECRNFYRDCVEANCSTRQHRGHQRASSWASSTGMETSTPASNAPQKLIAPG